MCVFGKVSRYFGHLVNMDVYTNNVRAVSVSVCVHVCTRLCACMCVCVLTCV